MKYRKLGRSGLSVSEIGFGCMSIHEDSPVNSELILKAFDRGINFFDTADLYDHGLNETIVGKTIRPIRDQIILATKVGNQWKEDKSGWTWNPRKAYILESVENSLRRLQTDYIDLYQLHGGTIDDPTDETIEAFESLVQSGKIRYYGISSIRPNVIRRFVERSNIVSVMMQYGLLDRRPEEECIPLLERSGIGILARGVLARGLLVNKPPAGFLNYSREQVQKAANAVASVTRMPANAAQTAVAFALHSTTISSAVVGISNESQLGEVIDTQGFEFLTARDLEILRNSVQANYYEQHR